MATCKRCGAETQFYSNGVPLCIPCSDGVAVKATPIPNDVQSPSARVNIVIRADDLWLVRIVMGVLWHSVLIES
jgi:hypothetical protein